MPDSAQAAKKPPGLRKTLAWCGFFLALDIFFVGAPMFGMYAGLALVVWLVPRIFLSRGIADLRRHRTRVALVTAAVLAADCGAYVVSEIVAEKRVVAIADALARHKAERNAYPLRLQDLVPAYLPAIPAPKPLSLLAGGILYIYDAAGPSLMYVSIPPYGRRVLNVVTREWTDVD